MVTYRDAVRAHLQRAWGRPAAAGPWHRARATDGFVLEILRFPPRADQPLWTYATCGMSSSEDPRPIELFLFARRTSRRST